MSISTELESEVRSYSRAWPVVFARASGSTIVDEDGREYLDFFAGAGALNYGHNNPRLKQVLLDYLAGDGVVHALDMFTTPRQEFLETFASRILRPRGLDHKAVFPGPGGANAVEAALKLARKVTGRHSVVSFTNSFHGMTLGALAVTGNALKRGGAGVPLTHSTPMPFDGYQGDGEPDLALLEQLLQDAGSGLDLPAAVIVESVQGEGGVNVARPEWLRALAELCTRHGVLLILDDVQMGCGRTGDFFSFEEAGIVPDIICLSKSISGYGLPMALTLIRPDLDVWAPGEHNGTFRGHNPAFVTATAALGNWETSNFADDVRVKGQEVGDALVEIADRHSALGAQVKGRGMIKGIAFDDPSVASRIARAAFERGLIIETAGPDDEVLKLLPPLTIDPDTLQEGLAIVAEAADAVIERLDSTDTVPTPQETNS